MWHYFLLWIDAAKRFLYVSKKKKENNDNERPGVEPEIFDLIGQSVSNALRNHYYYRHESN